jgi:hypothetical protein
VRHRERGARPGAGLPERRLGRDDGRLGERDRGCDQGFVVGCRRFRGDVHRGWLEAVGIEDLEWRLASIELWLDLGPRRLSSLDVKVRRWFHGNRLEYGGLRLMLQRIQERRGLPWVLLVLDRLGVTGRRLVRDKLVRRQLIMRFVCLSPWRIGGVVWSSSAIQSGSGVSVLYPGRMIETGGSIASSSGPSPSASVPNSDSDAIATFAG